MSSTLFMYHAQVNMEGDLPWWVGVVWWHNDGIANVLSQSEAIRENGFEVEYSNRKDKNRS